MNFARAMDRLGMESAFAVLAEAKRLEREGRDIVHLEIGEPDFDTPAHIVDAAIKAYQHAAATMTKDRGFDGIICGHLHYPVVREIEGILYCNDGDWVENCTALVEDFNGQLRLIRWRDGRQE